MDYTKCIGFADCPCRKCRDTRLAAFEAHPNHGHVSERSYCLTCKSQERERYAVQR